MSNISRDYIGIISDCSIRHLDQSSILGVAMAAPDFVIEVVLQQLASGI